MKVATSMAVLLLSASSAFAGGGAPEPAKPEGGPPSGRPGVILDDAKCTAVWSKVQREGDALVEDKAAPFIVNFKMVDTDGDGKVSDAEFKDGCKKGLVQEAASKPADAGGGGATPEKPKK